jgi:hypothetical protein
VIRYRSNGGEVRLGGLGLQGCRAFRLELGDARFQPIDPLQQQLNGLLIGRRRRIRLLSMNTRRSQDRSQEQRDRRHFVNGFSIAREKMSDGIGRTGRHGHLLGDTTGCCTPLCAD